ncbi:hypothetical protein JW711_03215 [Candidatus Woesearchaeota archaeon]|nr:hypothetical protein [Candidatus Woesearchaeota archaeon]
MALFKAYDAKVEVNGETVLSVVKGMGSMEKMGMEILVAHGINNPKPGMWYSQQSWLDAFKYIANKIGASTLKSIGKAIPENAQWPPSVNNVETALASIDVAYHMNHRIGLKELFDARTGQMTEGIGHYAFEKTGDRSAKVVCDNPYPDPFDQGIIESAAKKFAQTGEIVIVKIDEMAGTRTKGRDKTTFLITW